MGKSGLTYPRFMLDIKKEKGNGKIALFALKGVAFQHFSFDPFPQKTVSIGLFVFLLTQKIFLIIYGEN